MLVYLLISVSTLLLIFLTILGCVKEILNNYGDEIYLKIEEGKVKVNFYTSAKSIVKIIIISFVPLFNILLLAAMLVCSDEIHKQIIEKTLEKFRVDEHEEEF